MTGQSRLLCSYHYDPLDRIVGFAPTQDAGRLLFYQNNRFATQLQSGLHYSILQSDEHLLAQQNNGGNVLKVALLASDALGSVLHMVCRGSHQPQAYTAYGHHAVVGGLHSLLGFAGERRDQITGCYLLGNGYRAFNPALQRFNSPDRSSPFHEGGINGYAYCSADPINRVDSTGSASQLMLDLSKKALKRLQRSVQPLRSESKLRRIKFMSDQKANVLSQYPTLQNRRADRFLGELEYFKTASEKSPHHVLSINNPSDLGKVKGSLPLRFVFTNKSELLVDLSRDLNRNGVNHAILANYRAKGSDVIAAGMIKSMGSDTIQLWNDSGHYLPGFSTLQPLAIRLRAWRSKVEQIRVPGSIA